MSTLDHTKKAHRIDDSFDVKRIVTSVCQKLSIKNPEEYSFCEDPTWDEEALDGIFFIFVLKLWKLSEVRFRLRIETF